MSKKPKKLNSRRKGKCYERKIGKPMSGWWGVPWDNPGKLFHPTPLSGGWDREKAAGDILAPPDFPFSVECKNRQLWDFRDLIHSRRYRGNTTDERKSLPNRWFEQAVEACRPHQFPMLVFTRRQWEDYVLLDLRGVGFIEQRVGKLHDLAKFRRGLRLYTLDQILELDPDALGRRREQR